MEKTQNNFDQFFDFVDYYGLHSDEKNRVIGRIQENEWVEIFQKASGLIPRPGTFSSSAFNFTANGRISAFTGTCEALPCRIKKVDQLAQFSALYADVMMIYNPLDRYFGDHEIRIDINRFIDDIRILHRIRPLLDAGIIKLAPAKFSYCNKHYHEHFIPIKRDVEVFNSLIEEQSIEYVDFFVVSENGSKKLRLVGPEDLIEHGRITILLSDWPSELEPYMRDGVNQVPKEVARQLNLSRFVARDIYFDLLKYQIEDQRYNVNYLTDRALDNQIISAISNQNTRRNSAIISDGLSHSVPIIDNLSIERLVYLRKEEEDSFKVYRDAVSEALRLANKDEPTGLDKIYQETILPELNRISMRVKNAKKSASRQILTDASVVSIFLMIGLHDQSLSQILTLAGGARLAFDLATKANSYLFPTEEVMNNKYYFLWKAVNG